MLYYPKIPGSRGAPSGRCIAFEKYDGTNLHWDWDPEFGWHGFGTRRDEFDLGEAGREAFRKAHSHLHGCADLFLATLAEGLEGVFRDREPYRSSGGLRVFTEYFGPNSFAGLHRAEDPKELVLFDVWDDRLGMIGPARFVSDFGGLRIARVVYRGKLTGKFAEEVRTGKHGVAEGVVCKGGEGGSDLWMVKIKTYAYLEKLRKAFGEQWERYWE
jgi:hypothetical protein